MSLYTTILNLFKYDPVADANSTFNIKTALNDNFDKIETAVVAKASNAELVELLQGARNYNLVNGGEIKWGVTANVLSWSKVMNIFPAGGKLVRGGASVRAITIAIGSVTLPNAGDCMYIVLPSTDNATVVPAVANVTAIPNSNTLILAVRDVDSVLYFFGSGEIPYGTTQEVGGKKDAYVQTNLITAANDFLIGLSAGKAQKKTLAETKEILGVDTKVLKNHIINGGFDIWQRGVTFANPFWGQYVADRWKITNAYFTAPTITISKQEVVNGEVVGQKNYLRINVSGPGSNFNASGYAEHGITQPIENGVRSLCGLGKKITVTVEARSSIVGKKLGIYALQSYGTGGSPSGVDVLIGSNVTLTTSPQTFSITIDTATLVGKTFGTNGDDTLVICVDELWGSAIAARVGAGTTVENYASAGNIDIFNVSIASGAVGQKWQNERYADALRACQRYYQAIYTAYQDFQLIVSRISTTLSQASISLPTDMRIQPSVVRTSTDSAFARLVCYTSSFVLGTSTVTDITFKTVMNTNTIVVDIVHPAIDVSYIYVSMDTVAVGATLAFDAEL